MSLKRIRPLKIFNLMLLFFMSLILLIVAAPFLPTNKYFITYPVSDNIMESTISKGSVAFIQPLTTNTVGLNDIILFKSPHIPSEMIIRRIVGVMKEKRNNNFITKGDNYLAPDNWTVAPTDIKGRYIFSLPLIGYPISFIQTKIGLISIVFISLFLLIIYQIQKKKKV